jgi:hypothetical protein
MLGGALQFSVWGLLFLRRAGCSTRNRTRQRYY